VAVAAFPAFHVTGAIHHYVAWPAIAATPVYLGTCESSPQVAFQSFFGDWATDNSGPRLPEQRSEGGETASLAIGLNRFSKATWYSMLDAVAPTRRSAWSRGRPVFGRSTIQLWMVFENYSDVGTRDKFPSMEQGWYWPQVLMTGREHPRMGNGQETLLVVHAEAHPFRTPQADHKRLVAGEREWSLYSITPADFPASVLVPQ